MSSVIGTIDIFTDTSIDIDISLSNTTAAGAGNVI
jgi:hypothetical protein